MNTYDVTSENAEYIRNQAKHLLDSATFTVAVTGAGISKASGIPLVNEEMSGIPLRQLFRTDLLEKAPHLYYDLYREALSSWRVALPNDAHRALSKRGVWVITQNIDGLHRDAGTQHLIELHGNFRELACPVCGLVFSTSLAMSNTVPRCVNCDNVLRPGIVLEGEEVRHYSRAVDWAGRAQVLFVIGTNLNMAPVQQLPLITEGNGGHVFYINTESERLVRYLLNGANL